MGVVNNLFNNNFFSTTTTSSTTINDPYIGYYNIKHVRIIEEKKIKKGKKYVGSVLNYQNFLYARENNLKHFAY